MNSEKSPRSSNAHRIFIDDKKPVEQDDGGSLIYRASNGKLYRVFGIMDCEDQELIPKGYREIVAVISKIRGRTSEMFVAANQNIMMDSAS